MESNQEEEPVSPTGQYLNSSTLSLTIMGVLELESPIDDLRVMPLLRDVFLPINSRYSSLMVDDKNGNKIWKRVEVKLEDHLKIPTWPEGMSQVYYDECFNEYFTKIGMEKLPQTQPLWEIHRIKYPTSNAVETLIFKLHHALGDGYSIMGVLFSILKRADNPSLPLTFPSRKSSNIDNGISNNISRIVPQIFSKVNNTLGSFARSLIMSTVVEDDRTPIRSGDDGIEFKPSTITTMEFSLDHLKKIKHNLKVTINDVITGIIIYGTRLYMQEANPELNDSLSTALVLFNTRNLGGYKSISEMVKPNSEMPWGNYFTFLHVPMMNQTDSNSSNPIKFVMQAREMIDRQRNSSAVYIIGFLLKILKKFKGPEATAKVVHSTIKNSSMAISNLIGPLEKMALDNQPVGGLYFSVSGAPTSLVVTLVSYMGQMRLCIGVEKGFIDPQKLKSSIQTAFDIIFKASLKLS